MQLSVVEKVVAEHRRSEPKQYHSGPVPGAPVQGEQFRIEVSEMIGAFAVGVREFRPRKVAGMR